MSKVIRIPEPIFSRLQQHAEPLIDSPITVIERLLNFYEKHNKTESNQMKTKVSNSTVIDKKETDVFLAPASSENIKRSITSKVDMTLAKKYLSPQQFDGLLNSLNGESKFHCWAMSENSRPYYRVMKAGDKVVFKITGSGRFNFVGDVIYKFENEEIGNEIWDVVPGEPWSLIFILDKIRPINIDRVKFVQAFGYKPNYDVPGFRRVSQKHLSRTMSKHGSLKELIKNLEA